MDTYLDLPREFTPEVANSVRALFVAPDDSSATEIETLDNIIKACALTAGLDVDTLRLPEGARLSVSPLPEACTHIVCFGLSTREVGLVAEVLAYEWTAPMGGRRYCFAERLSVIGEDMGRKKQLWATVKSLKAFAAAAP